MLAYQLDEALAFRILMQSKQDHAVTTAVGIPDRQVIAAGDRYVTPADFGVPLEDPGKAEASRVAFLEMLENERGSR